MNKTKIFTTILFLVFLAKAYGQIHLNPGVDTSSVEHKEILSFWEDYIASEPSKNSNEYLKFWNQSDRKIFVQPDLVLHSINTEQSTLMMGYPTLLSILPYQQDFFEIKTAVGWSDPSGHISLLAIVNHYVKKENGEYQLYIPLNIKEDVRLLEQKDFKIYTNKNSNIPEDILDRLSDFISDVKQEYEVSDNRKLMIIYGKNDQETDQLLGFDFNLMSSTNNPSSGIADLKNNLIILNGLASIFHEVTHIYLNPLFPESPLLEGLATFYGGNFGKSLNDGITFLYNYISKNTEVNLYEELKGGSFYINNEINPLYILQGLLISIAHEKSGVAGIKELMSFKSYDEIFESYFKVKDTDNINRFLKSELKKRAIK